jgi:hypothetical protein
MSIRIVELQGVAARGRLGISEHDPDLHADLVDEDEQGLALGHGGGELAHGLAHEAGLQAHVGIAHVPLDLGSRRQGRHGVDDDDVERVRLDHGVGHLEGLLAVVGLVDEKIVDVHAQLVGVADVERVLGVDEERHAPDLLGLGNGVKGQGGLARGLGTVDLDDPAPGVPADARGDVDSQRPGRYALDPGRQLAAGAQLHDGALAVLLLDGSERGLEGPGPGPRSEPTRSSTARAPS